jgi:hypothetical protein
MYQPKEHAVAESKCAKCDASTFEIKPFKPTDAAAEIVFVQCAKCGSVAGVVEATKVSALLKELHNKVIVQLAAMDQKIIALQFKK